MKVVCIDKGNFRNNPLVEGNIYEVIQVVKIHHGCPGYLININGYEYEYLTSRFRPATPLDLVKARLK